MKAVTKVRIATASDNLRNADLAAIACREVGLSYFDACTLLEMESGGRNIWGGDDGSVTEHLQGKPVTAVDWVSYIIKVEHGATANGWGPCQLTYPGRFENGRRVGGYHSEMLAAGMTPWDPLDNMRKGFSILAANFRNAPNKHTGWARYNGGPHPNADAIGYADRAMTKSNTWKKRLGVS